MTGYTLQCSTKNTIVNTEQFRRTIGQPVYTMLTPADNEIEMTQMPPRLRPKKCQFDESIEILQYVQFRTTTSSTSY